MDRLHRFCFNDLIYDIRCGFRACREKWGNGARYIYFDINEDRYMIHKNGVDVPWNSEPGDLDTYDWFIV